MAVYINRLNGGDITIGSSGGVTPVPKPSTTTRVWYGDNENVYTDYEIVGTIINEFSEDEGTSIPNSESLKKIEIGNTVTNIGDEAFNGCYSLTSVTIPDSVNSIGFRAFAECGKLITVTIIANGGNAQNVKNMIIEAIADEWEGTDIASHITWNMPS